MTRMITTIQIMVHTKPGIAQLPTLATAATVADAQAYREDLGMDVEELKFGDPLPG